MLCHVGHHEYCTIRTHGMTQEWTFIELMSKKGILPRWMSECYSRGAPTYLGPVLSGWAKKVYCLVLIANET